MEKFLSTKDKPQPRNIVQIQKVQDIPKGAVRMSKEEVIFHHMKIIREWDKSSQVWPLRHGLGIVAGASALGGFLVNAHYRQKFKLRHYGRLASYLPAVCLPAMMTALFHQFVVINPILLGDYSCTLCMETRSGIINTCLGAIYPMVISPVSCIVLARKYYTMSVPKITEGAMIFNLFKKTSPMMGGLFLLIAAQFFLGMFLAEREIMTFQNYIGKSLHDIDREEEELY